MRVHSQFFRYIVLITFFTIALFGQENQIFKIITPFQLDVSDEGIAYTVVEAQGGIVDSFTITTDSNKTFNTLVNSKRSYYCKSIPLHMGENTLTVSGYREGILVKKQKRMIFFISKIFKEYKYPPKKYQYNYFHNDVNEKACTKCHDMSVNEVKGVAFIDVKKSNCYQCHHSIIKGKFAHAPAVNWLCTSCHNGSVGKYNIFDANKTKYTVPDPIENVCYSCHEKIKDKWSKKRFKHEPAASGRCNKCHNPHTSNNLNFLRKPTWELCTTCHQDKIKGAHIVKTFGRVMHPTHGVKDPSKASKEQAKKDKNPLLKGRVLSEKDKELNCVSCHNPHASNAPSLLQSDTLMGLCSRCHKK